MSAPGPVTGLSGKQGFKLAVPVVLLVLLAGVAAPLVLFGAMGNTGALPGINLAAGGDDGSGGGGWYGPGGSTHFNVNDSTFQDLGGSANAWGGHSNGRIPASELCPIPWASHHTARCDAVDALARLNAAYRGRFGADIAVTDSYRSYEDQVAIRAQWCAKGACYMAATPGTSNHGWALAFDLGGGINSYSSAQYAWMKTNAGRHGIFHPTWAEPGHPDYTKPEPWHWQFVPASQSDDAPAAGSDGTPTGNRALGKQMAAARGWTGAEWTCLEQLWTRESGWNQFADNPTSSAYGIPQALPGSKMAAAGPDWQTNPATQITWGLGYVADRYGSPCEAWAFSNRFGWY